MPTPLYANHAEWIAGIKNWLETDDQPDVDTELFFYLAQLRLNRELQSVPMEESVDITITAGMVGLPIDLLAEIPDFNKIRLVIPYAYAKPSKVIAINEMLDKIADEFTEGVPYTGPDRREINYYCIDSRMLYLYPWPGEDAVVTIKYYVEVPFITPTNDTNIFSIFHSDILLSASLLAGSQFIIEDERVPMFENSYALGLDSSNNTGKHQNMGSTPLGRQIKGLS